MRALTLATIIAIGAADAASAQGLYEDPGRYLALQQSAEMAQRDAAFRQQEYQAAQARADTETRLSGLAQQRQTANAALYTQSMRSGAQIDAQLGVDSNRLDQLTDAALARSNARVLAVQPVLR